MRDLIFFINILMGYGINMQNVYILMGLPGAGKTTWAEKKTKENDNTIIISRDDIRYMLSHSYRYNSSQRHQAIVNTISLDMMKIGFA